MNLVFKGRLERGVRRRGVRRRRGRGQVCMLAITLFKQMAPSLRLIEIAKSFAAQNLAVEGRGEHVSLAHSLRSIAENSCLATSVLFHMFTKSIKFLNL